MPSKQTRNRKCFDCCHIKITQLGVVINIYIVSLALCPCDRCNITQHMLSDCFTMQLAVRCCALGVGVFTIRAFFSHSSLSKAPNSTLQKTPQRNLELFNTKGLPKYSKVPRMIGETFFVWETDPQQIIMMENSHLRWYETKSEKNVIALQRHLLKSQYSPKDGIVVDMGINDGYIAALAAAYGYKTVAVDGQPECVRRFLIATRLNSWGKLVTAYNNIVCSKSFVLAVKNGVCGGGSRYLEKENPTANLKPGKGVVVDIDGATNVSTVSLDTLVGLRPVVFFHLDVEGAELEVLLSGKMALQHRQIKNIVWEFAAHRWVKSFTSSLRFVKETFKAFICRDVATIDFQHNPFKSPKIITNWDSEFEIASVCSGHILPVRA